MSSPPQHTEADLLDEIAALRERETELEAARASAVEVRDLARRALDTSPERVADLLAKAREQVTAANAELRELARGLHPRGGDRPAAAAAA